MLPSDRGQALAITPLWRLAFRPFFLFGALFAASAMVLWLGLLFSGLSLPHGQAALGWHRHEMVFGFAGAIIAGFLLTAVQNWTGQPGLSGKGLVLLVLLWLAARLAWFAPLPPLLLAGIEIAFLPLLAALMARHLWRARQRNNYPIVGVLLLLCLCQAQVLLGLVDNNDGLQRRGIQAAMWLVAGLLGLIGGRVIPFFTQRGLARSRPFAPSPRLDALILVGSLVVAVLGASGLSQRATPGLAPFFIVLGCLYGLRLWQWHDGRLWRVPLLWSLHLAYAWLIVAAGLSAAWHAGATWLTGAAVHALGVGAMSGAILAMMARVSLGHTGRPLQPPRAVVWGLALLQLAAFVRVLLALFWVAGLWLSGLLFVVAFILFVVSYGPLLCKPRIDGHPG